VDVVPFLVFTLYLVHMSTARTLGSKTAKSSPFHPLSLTVRRALGKCLIWMNKQKAEAGERRINSTREEGQSLLSRGCSLVYVHALKEEQESVEQMVG
jgi:hypothetical protein